MNAKDKKIKCVVLCAGRGTRLGAEDKPKPLYEVNGKPILFHVIDFWKQFTNDFVFVVGYEKEMVIEFVKTLPINAEFVVQKELKGIAHAIYLTKDLITERFIVVLGDCICTGNFIFPENLENGFSMFETDDVNAISNSFSVELENGVAKRLVEKPKNPKTNLCGMGFYFFTKEVFD
ncbi:MAG: nucleotidyltransferase family protein, partial [Candidatus Aenigmarchaeota archaeon]